MNAKLTAEYNHLKAQVNPHFLFNTLNSFYSATEPVLPETAKGIMLLSDIMRYSLETGGHDGKVPLNDELLHLQYYIELMQFRFNNELNIKGNLFSKGQLNKIELVEHWRILPHLLITIAENAFKHGDNSFPFEMNLTLTGQQLHFVFKNTIGLRKSISGTGIGVNNMIQRIHFTYGTDGRFISSVEESDYIAELFLTEKMVSLNNPINKAS
ncbi:MAG: histidine kinase [Dinghuibacter sp.]|nr:histidine kinase [Dinghuibacter sp.]